MDTFPFLIADCKRHTQDLKAMDQSSAVPGCPKFMLCLQAYFGKTDAETVSRYGLKKSSDDYRSGGNVNPSAFGPYHQVML